MDAYIVNNILNNALNAATILLSEDHHLVEAISAARRGRFWFRPEYDMELVEVSAHLNAVELEAHSAANLCANAGLPALADCCKRIAHRVSVANRNGTDDTCAVADLSRLTTAGQEELDIQSDLHAESISRI